MKEALEQIAQPLSDLVALKRAGAKDISAEEGSSLVEPSQEKVKEDRDLMPIDRMKILNA